MTIRFYRPKVPYEEALYIAATRALARRADVAFDLVAVSPKLDDPSKITVHSAENVFHSLTSMDLAAERVSLSATTSASVQSDEVQLYAR